ncbi:hypothetical protein ACFL4T_00575 [candidate division KSB1 bacterium]
MAKFYRFRFGIVLLSVLLLAAFFSCSEQPYNRALPNLVPDTFIGDVALTPVGAFSTEYTVTVQYSGLDRDSRITYFEYHWGDEQWEQVDANYTSATAVLDFPTTGTEFEFYVRAIDEQGAVDNSPAYLPIPGTLAHNERPTISIAGAPSGSEISPYTSFVVKGNDAVGKIDHIEWKLDADGVWKTVYPDPSDYSTTVELWNMPEGYHTFYTKAVDNFGAESNVLTATFLVRGGGYFAPFVTSDPPEGDLLLYPLGEEGDWPDISVTADADFYFCDISFYSYSTNGGVTWTTQQTPIDFTWEGFVRSAAEIELLYRIYDKGGNIVEGSLTYVPLDIQQIITDNGIDILMVNGNDFESAGFYGTGMSLAFAVGGFTNDLPFAYFEGNPTVYALGSRPPGFPSEAVALGFGSTVPPALMDMVDVIIGLFNNYGGDQTTYNNSIANMLTWVNSETDNRLVLSGRYFADYFWSGIDQDFGEDIVWHDDAYPITSTGAIAGMPDFSNNPDGYGSAVAGVEDPGAGYTVFLEGANGYYPGVSKDDADGIPKIVLLCWRNYDLLGADVEAIYDALYALWGY